MERQAALADPLSLEFGALQMICQKAASRMDAYRGLATHAREVRNTIAHYKPIAFSDYRRLIDLLLGGQDTSRARSGPLR